MNYDIRPGNRHSIRTLEPLRHEKFSLVKMPGATRNPENKRIKLTPTHKPRYMSSTATSYFKPRTVLFYKNGDKNLRTYHVSITQRRFNTFHTLLNELTRITKVSQGVRYIFSSTTGRPIKSIEEIKDGQSYVCAAFPKLIRLNYDGRQQDSPVASRNFTPVPQVPMIVDSNRSTSNVRPRIITVIRSTLARKRRCIKVLLNKRTAQTFEQVLNDITATVGIEGGTGVRKLYNIKGNLISDLSQLFGEDDIFIAVGTERFRSSDLQNIIELYGLNKHKTKTNINAQTPSPLTLPKIQDRNIKTHKQPIKNTKYTNNVLPKIKSREKNKETSKEWKVIVETHDELKLNLVTYDIVNKGRVNDEKPDNELTTNNEKNEKVETGYASMDDSSVATSMDDSSVATSMGDSSVATSKTTKPESMKSETEIAKAETESTKSEETTTTKSDETATTKSDGTAITKSETKKAESIKEDTGISNTETNKSDTESVASTTESLKSELKSDEIVSDKVTYHLSDGSEIEKYFDLGKKLGDGNFAVVKEGYHKTTGERVAVKIIDAAKITDKQDMLENEISIQRKSNHPNIVRLYHDFRSPESIFLSMELVMGGDFFDLVSECGRIEETKAASFVRDLTSGLDYLHQRKIVHRDIKPENLMVHMTSTGEEVLKIADFGLAMEVTRRIFTICGTPTYVAPEILTEEGYGLEVDIWAAGVIVYIMLCGFPPFRSANRKQTELFDLIEAGEFEFTPPYWDDVSESAKDLINHVIVVDVTKRYTAVEVLQHDWIATRGLLRNNTQLSIAQQK